MTRDGFETRMRFTWDENKRQATLQARGLDFAHANRIFERGTFTWEDTRNAYGEQRFITLGSLDADVIVLVHTESDERIRVISMRKAYKDEQDLYFENVGLQGS